MGGMLIKLPELKPEIILAADWFVKRDKLVDQAAEFLGVEKDSDFAAASALLKEVTVTSNGLEKLRKELSDPYNLAAKTIKGVADKAREPLELAKKHLSDKMATYAAAQERKRREEMARIEDERRRQVEEEMARQEEAADLFGDDSAPTVQIVVAALAPETRLARNSNVAVGSRVVWEVVDLNRIPNAFLIFDPRAVNEYVREHGASIKTGLENGESFVSPIPGILFSLETKIKTR